jgi:ribosome-binding protein aMBF1 (putative translation factor)
MAMLRRLSEQDFYQVLEVGYDASSTEIQSAYEQAREIYSRDGLVSVSILSEHERRRTYERIAEAYQTLIAEESRRLYDESIGVPRRPGSRGRPVLDRVEKPERRETNDAREVRSAAPMDPVVADAAPDEREPRPSPAKVAREPRSCPIQLGLTDEASGEFLRTAREALGLDLTTISEETKIGCSMLEYIESERIDRLPAAVYLRNFTLQIARCLGLDEEKVSRTYLARIRRLQSNV